jgi:hypothetical protein
LEFEPQRFGKAIKEIAKVSIRKIAIAVAVLVFGISRVFRDYYGL